MTATEDYIGPAELAREAIKYYLENEKLPQVPETMPPEYSMRAGVFVSLKESGRLRGCIGTFEPVRGSLAEEIVANAVNAAVNDPRFAPLRNEELPGLSISVDILSPLEKVKSEDELDPKIYGILVRSGSRSGLLLPGLEGLDTVEEQLKAVRQKARIAPDEHIDIYRFKVTRHKER